MYPEYKAQRGPCPEDLAPQFGLVREAADAFGAVQIEAVGYEADDVSGGRLAKNDTRDALYVSYEFDAYFVIRLLRHWRGKPWKMEWTWIFYRRIRISCSSLLRRE